MLTFAPSTKEGTARLAKKADRQQIAELIYLGTYVHQHPSWLSPLEAIGEPGFVVLEEGKKLTATLALLKENPATAWVRLFAANTHIPPKLAWERLWDAAAHQIAQQGIRWIAAMPFEEWFQELIESHGFKPYQVVEMLAWKPRPLPPARKAQGLKIRNMRKADLPAVHEIDRLAFGAFWSANPAALMEGLKRSVWARVVEDPNSAEVLGFQISTATPLGGHLARIAVHPKAQRRGIGYWLVHDVLTFFSHQNAAQVTLNTQGNNEVALALYKRLGFSPTEEQLPVLVYSLDGSMPPSGGNM